VYRRARRRDDHLRPPNLRAGPQRTTEELAALIDAGLLPNLTNDRGDTLLLLAAYHAHPATVRLLVGRGADLSRVNDRGQTALGGGGVPELDRVGAGAARRRRGPGAGVAVGAGGGPFFELPEMSALLQGP